MNKITDQQKLEDLESILGPLSLLDAKLDQGLHGSLFDLDIDLNIENQTQNQDRESVTKEKIQ